ncbi:MAG: hypothetical protein ACRD2C_13165 [Acidimicrobiales bacterium]
MTGPDESPQQVEEVQYYTIVLPDGTRDDPTGLARRRHTAEGPIDEHLRRDFTWAPSSVIFVWESGDVGERLYEISEAEAEALIERFRSRWQSTDQ